MATNLVQTVPRQIGPNCHDRPSAFLADSCRDSSTPAEPLQPGRFGISAAASRGTSEASRSSSHRHRSRSHRDQHRPRSAGDGEAPALHHWWRQHSPSQIVALRARPSTGDKTPFTNPPPVHNSARGPATQAPIIHPSGLVHRQAENGVTPPLLTPPVAATTRCALAARGTPHLGAAPTLHGGRPQYQSTHPQVFHGAYQGSVDNSGFLPQLCTGGEIGYFGLGKTVVRGPGEDVSAGMSNRAGRRRRSG